MRPLPAWRPRHPIRLAAGVVFAVLALGTAGHHTGPSVHARAAAGGPAVVLTAARTASPATTAPSAPAPAASTGATTSTSGTGGSGTAGEGPPPIQVGPPGTTAPSAPAVGSGGTVSGGTQPSPGLFDITGHIEAAIDDWFRSLVTDALDPVLTLLGHTLLATPNVTAQSRVGQLWRMTEGIADAFLVLFVLAGGAIVMGHETFQTRTALRDVLPRVVVAAVAVNASLGLAGLAISTAATRRLAGSGVVLWISRWSCEDGIIRGAARTGLPVGDPCRRRGNRSTTPRPG